jgi:cell volume regulation protein A
MDAANFTIMLGAGLVLLSVLSILFSQRFGVPLLLVFLAIGMLAGIDGPGHISFSNFHLTYLVGSIALVIILMDGGLNTTGEALKLSVAPATLLATLGVIITAGLTAAGCYFFLHVTLKMAMLLGAIVASTDAAAVFFLLRQHGILLHPKLKAVLEIESGMNDPAAVLLVAVFGEVAAGANIMSPAHAALHLIYALAVGAGVGFFAGRILIFIIRKAHLARGLYPIMALSAVLFIFGLMQQAGASGFLAAYVMGITLRTMRHPAIHSINNFSNGMAWMSQILMFLVLGLLAAPHAMVPHLAVSFAIAAILMFIARPVAVFLCLLPFHYTWREMLFVSWVGLRVAVPIYLATVPVLMGVDDSVSLFSVVFVVVILSLMMQGWSIPLVARVLRLGKKTGPFPAQEEGSLPAPSVSPRPF